MEHDAYIPCSATFDPSMKVLVSFIYALALVFSVGYTSDAQMPPSAKSANGLAVLQKEAASMDAYAFVSEPAVQHHFTAYEYSETRDSEDDESSHSNEQGGTSPFAFAHYYASLIDYVHQCAGVPSPVEGRQISYCVLHAVFLI